MSEIKAGDRVSLKNDSTVGTVLGANPDAKMAFVEWPDGQRSPYPFSWLDKI